MAGSYNVTVTDNNGCTSTASATVSEPSAITATDVTTNASCNGLLDAGINVTIGGGSPGYTFLWSNGSTNEDLSGIGADNYTLSVTDANGCQFVHTTVTVTEPSAISVTNISPTDATCANNDGTIDITTGGGVGGYTYLWSNGEKTEDVSGLSANSYFVTITDNDGCSIVSSAIPIQLGTSVIITIDSTENESCSFDSTGIAYITISGGGNLPYTYNWSNGSTAEDLTAVTGGTYYVTVTENVGCIAIDSVKINNPLIPTINPVILPTNSIDTTLDVGDGFELDGGNNQTTSGVSYVWTVNGPGTAGFVDANAHNTMADPSEEGSYTFLLTATSADGCVDTGSVHVTLNPANNPQIPNAFAPNGHNKIFRVFQLENEFLKEFKIFNRWGEVIYENVAEGAWDGTYKGVAQPTGVYMYIISWQLPGEATPTIIRGNVTLLR